MSQCPTSPLVPTIALGICTLNRPQDLYNCLRSVFDGSRQPDEIIVSDDSPAAMARENQAVVAQFPGVTYQAGPQRGLGPNRNACIQAATSDFVIFTDDDVCVTADFFATAYQQLPVRTEGTILTGFEWNHHPDKRKGDAPGKITPQNADFWGLQRVAIAAEPKAIVINATFFPRSLLQRVQFDENLRYGSDEIDVVRHALSKGYRIQYCDALAVHHYPSPVNRDRYAKWVHASRLYATTKAYWVYEQAPLKTLAYVLLAPLQLLGSQAKTGSAQAVGRALQSVLLASQYLWRYAHSPSR